MKTNILADFQICIIVPVNAYNDTFVNLTISLEQSWWQHLWGKPLASVAKKENDQFDSFASRKTRDCRQHCSAAVDVEELVLLFK